VPGMAFDLGHHCSSCGGSCQGVLVRPDDAEHSKALTEMASALGIDRPIVAGRLRQNRGRCCFLRDDNLCAIHASFGPQAKPAICRQYPLVVVNLDGIQRTGIDPGCYTHHDRRDADPLTMTDDLTQTEVRDTPAQRNDSDLVHRLLTHPNTNAELVVRTLSNAPWGPFHRIAHGHMKPLGLALLLQRADASPCMRQSLDNVALCLDSAPPNERALQPNRDAHALNCTDRMVHLHLSSLPAPQVALLMMCGTVLLNAVHESDDAFARGLAGWARLVRTPAFLAALGAQ
jgi:Fe-S-cluster containining protein